MAEWLGMLRIVAGEQPVQGGTEGIDVALGGGEALVLLGRRVAGGTNHSAEAGRNEGPRDTEVHHRRAPARMP